MNDPPDPTMQERSHHAEVIPLRPPTLSHTGGAAAVARAFDEEFQKGLFASLDAALQSTDDYLFDLADKSVSSMQQNTHFDSMRTLRLQRMSINSLFATRVRASLDGLLSGKLPNSQHGDGSGPRDSSAELSLVETDALEESLAVVSLVDRCYAAFARPLHALHQRVGQALSLSQVNGSNNPAAPAQLAAAAAQAFAPADLPVDVRLIFFKHLERHWLGLLGPLYDRANRLLAEAGILPELRYQVGRNPSVGRAPSSHPNEPMAGNADTGYSGQTGAYANDPALPGNPDGEVAPVLAELLRLLGGGAQNVPTGPNYGVPQVGSFARYPGAPGGAATSPVIDPQALMNALSMLQAEHLGGANAELNTEQTRAQVLQRARGLVGGDAASSLRHFDETALNLVGMLFDYAIEDRHLPGELKSLLSRLQIPYLKVALVDPTFVARKDHPARALLDDLATAALGWSASTDRDRSLYLAIESLVRSVITDFDQDIGVFDRARKQLDELLNGQRRRADVAEKRTTEAARGRERLEQAQKATALELLQRVDGKSMPSRLRDLLTKRWSNYLVMTHLRNGQDSVQWKDAIRVVEMLADAPRRIAEETTSGEAMAEVEQILKHGLIALGLHEEDIDELWSGIAELLNAESEKGQLEVASTPGEAAPTAKSSISPAPPAQPSPGAIQALPSNDPPIIDHLEIRFGTGSNEVVYTPETTALQAPAPLPGDDAASVTVQKFKPGIWMEFLRADGSSERSKLLWVSTVRSQYLFVNRNGVKSGEYSAEDLANLLNAGQLQVLEGVGLVDRALNAIVRKLRGSKASAN